VADNLTVDIEELRLRYPYLVFEEWNFTGLKVVQNPYKARGGSMSTYYGEKQLTDVAYIQIGRMNTRAKLVLDFIEEYPHLFPYFEYIDSENPKRFVLTHIWVCHHTETGYQDGTSIALWHKYVDPPTPHELMMYNLEAEKSKRPDHFMCSGCGRACHRDYHKQDSPYGPGTWCVHCYEKIQPV
jgi:hypothetical protein